MTRRIGNLTISAATIGLLVWLLPVAANDDSQTRSLRQRQHDLRLQLISERARILQNDPRAVAVRERIQQLYRDLDDLVAQKPAVKRLQNELEQVEAALQKADTKH